MTLRRTAPLKKQRWLGLLLVVCAMGALLLSTALSHSGVNTIPARFFTVEDEQGANDVPGQVDLTQMGRDDTNASIYSVFWSWDSIDQWTGQGQTGDACALFDTDSDTNINFVACVRIENPNADPTVVKIRPIDATHAAFLFGCSDKKNDRCTNPDPVAYLPGEATAGLIQSSLATALDPNANLITDTDPFDATDTNGPGTSHPHDSTVELRILKAKIAGNDPEVLVNVCSYPSAGNGGNNNPFDCIVSPGGGFITIVKDADDATSPNFTFDVHRGATLVAQRTIAGDGTATPVPILVGSTAKVTETNIPSDWELQTASCELADGTTVTGTFNGTDAVSGITVQSGQVTTCTFVDRLKSGTLTVIKTVVNDHGGSALSSNFTMDLNDGSATFAGSASGTQFTLPVGHSWNVTETGPSGYAADFSADCSGTMTANANLTCTVTNDDIAPQLTVIKTVINDNGGTASASDFTLDSGGTNDSPDDFAGSESGTVVTLDAGSYNVSETGPAGYSASFSVDCSGNIAVGESKTCTVTNNDNAATLIVIKHVTNDSGLQAVAGDFTMLVTATNPSDASFPGEEAPGTSINLDAGTYSVAETGPSGYTASFSADCSGSIANGETKTCTVTNDDNPASPGITTSMSWTLHDSVTLTGFRSGGTASTVHFYLYLDDDTCSDPNALVFDQERPVTDATGAAATTGGHTTSESGTYYWFVTFSGNNFNDAHNGSGTCGAEITTLP